MTAIRGSLVEGTRHWTAAELGALEDGICRRLRQEGIGPRARVAVAIRDTALYLTTVLAARATGAVVVLLASGREKAIGDVDRCLVDSEPDVVLVDEDHAAALAGAIRESGAHAFTLACDGTLRRIAAAAPRARTAHPDQAAVIC
jgi:acyl-CoA synthetase (AMP-forming)/AMP-acid ligase II